jgi:enoyl-CoA hydratase/carnithine racemase
MLTHALQAPASLSLAAVDGLRAALAGASGVVVLRGAPAVFCRGLDAADGALVAGLERVATFLHTLRTLPLPTIAVVEGEALGGGVGLAAACDVVLAGPHARFGLPEAMFGLLPNVIRPLLEERVPAQALRRLVLTGESVDAGEAVRLGLADCVAADVDAYLPRYVRTLGRAAPDAVAGFKRAPDLLPRMLAGARLTAEMFAAPGAVARRARFARGAAPWDEEDA